MNIKGFGIYGEISLKKDYTYALWQSYENPDIGIVSGYDFDWNGTDSHWIFKTPPMPFIEAENLMKALVFGVDVYYGNIPTHNEITPELWK